MEPTFRSRTSRGTAFLLGLIAAITCTGAFADSPATLAGYTLDLVVKSATAPFSATGNYRIYVSDDGGSYGLLNVGSPSDSTGSCSYSRTTVSNGRFLFNDSVRGSGFSIVFTFSDSDSGTFFLGNTNYPGYQRGDFTAFLGTAPANISGKRIRLTVTGGAAPFDASGTYSVITATSTYAVEETAGEAASTGDIIYSKRNRTSGNFGFIDSQLGQGFNVLSFATSTNGSFLARQSSGNGYQTGTFTLGDYFAPVITRHPTNRLVLIGSSFTLSATVTGSPPIRYQWFRHDAPITGATNSSYSVSYAQESDVGLYHVEARNLGGAAGSSNAWVTATCGFALSTNAAFVSHSGGNGSFQIRTTGTCQWQANSSNHWITVTAGQNGVGDGTISFNVSANTTGAPRTGRIVAGGKQFTIAQGGDFAPASLFGRTLVFSVQNGSTNLFQGAKASFSAGSGTNRTYAFVSTNRTVSGNYGFTKTSRTAAGLSFSPVTLALSFTTAVSGTFSGTDRGDAISGSFRIVRSAPDFNADRHGDLLLQNTNRVLAAWLMHGTNVLRSALLRNGVPASAGWRGISTGDFNRDGHADVLFADSTGKAAAWLMYRTNQMGVVALPNAFAASGWSPVAANDFNQDGNSDLLVAHSSRRMAIWFYARTNFVSSAMLRGGEVVLAGWRAVGTGDLSGDGQTDILFQHDNGQLAVWLMNGSQFIVSHTLRNGQPAPVGWRLVAISDINNDGQLDLVWQNALRQVIVWTMNRTSVAGVTALQNSQSLPVGWSVFGPK